MHLGRAEAQSGSSIAYLGGVPAKSLIPEQEDLLCELVDAYESSGDRPQIRVGLEGRSGARVWMQGRPHRGLDGRRKEADFVELQAQGFLRKIKKDKTGSYFSITANGLAERERIKRRRSPRAVGPASTKTAEPPQELTGARPRLETLRAMATEAGENLDALVAISVIVERFQDEPGGMVVITTDPWTWAPLSAGGQQLLGAARIALDAWLEEASGAVHASAPERLEDFEDHSPTLRCVVERSSRSQGPPAGDIVSTQRYVSEALAAQLALVEDLPSAHQPAETVLVPDTNALLFKPAIDEWTVGGENVAIVVLPQVIAELDRKKVDRAVGEKASGLIRRFKEFDRRGNTLEGVPLAGKTTFREVAHDPSFDGAPTWLSRSNADDRLLVGALELAQRQLTSRVVLVTRDRNMQNKARRLGLPYVDAEAL
jgi:rRNA maturation endonuclease Nob1